MPKKSKKLATRKQGQAFLKAFVPVQGPRPRPQPPKGRGRRGR